MAKKYSQRSDGRWATTVWDGTYRNGKKHRVTLMSSKSSRDLEKKVADFEKKRDEGSFVNNDIVLADYAARWLETKALSLAPGTVRSYRQKLARLDFLQMTTFSTLNTFIVQDYIKRHQEASTIARYDVKALQSMLLDASKQKLIPRGAVDDIFSPLVFPKHEAKKKRPLYDCELEAIAKADLTERERAFVYVLLGGGLRRNEALALRSSCVSDGCIRVEHSLFNAGERTLTPPKSKRGVRTVPIPPEIYSYLEEYSEGKDILFPNRKGEFMDAGAFQNFWRNIIAKIKAVEVEAELPADAFEISPHYFRHNFCSRLCYVALKDRTISVKKIAEILGDKDEMVLDVYSHLMAEQEDAAGAVASAIKLH